MEGSQQALTKWFDSLSEATTFANKKPQESILEIKHYANKANNIQDEPHNFR
jgi:hypothetical protein